MTQDDLSAKSGISTVTITAYESGSRLPSLWQLEKLLTALQCDPAELIYKLKAARGRTTDTSRVRKASPAVARPAPAAASGTGGFDLSAFLKRKAEESRRGELFQLRIQGATLREIGNVVGLSVGEVREVLGEKDDRRMFRRLPGQAERNNDGNQWGETV